MEFGCPLWKMEQPKYSVLDKSIYLLWNGANTLSSETHAERLLKSYYVNTCRKIARHNVQLPDDIFGKACMCERCGNQWKDGNYKLRLRPQRLADNAKRRKMVAKLDKAEAKLIRGALTSAQRNRAKWLKKRLASQMEIDCAVCKHKTMVPLGKPKKQTKKPHQQDRALVHEHHKTKNQQIEKMTKNVKSNLHKQEAFTTKAVSVTPAGVLPRPTTSTKNKQPTQANVVSKKNKKNNQKMKASAQASKMQSKTQKQNSLLQLAAMLKMQDSKDAERNQNNRLNAFLK